MELTKEGANVNTAGPIGMTALHFLSTKGLSHAVLELINAKPMGANINARTHEHSTPLHAAVAGAHLDLALLLVEEEVHNWMGRAKGGVGGAV